MRCSAALGLAAFALLTVPPAAHAQYQWVRGEINETVRFEGDGKNCKFDRTSRYFHVPQPARNIVVHEPEEDDRVESDKDTEYATVSYVGPSQTAAQILIQVYGRGRFCINDKAPWESEDVRVHITYEHAVPVSTPPAPTPPRPVTPLRLSCGNQGFLTIRNVRALRTSCLAAKSVARRYLATRRIIGVHRLAPYTCFDHRVVGAREVTCRAIGRRYVWFRYVPGARSPA